MSKKLKKMKTSTLELLFKLPNDGGLTGDLDNKVFWIVVHKKVPLHVIPIPNSP